MAHPLAGKPAPQSALVDVPLLVSAYFTTRPDVAIRSQQVAFGTSGHRGSSLKGAFNEAHILAIAQAIANHRRDVGITGPLFMGIDTHALSRPAQQTALEVLAANGVEVLIDSKDGFTPTPAVSVAILQHNSDRPDRAADGVVITPSHNPPEDGGFKYNPPHGGPAGSDVTTKIQDDANALLAAGLEGVKRMSVAKAMRAPTTHRYDFITPYVKGLRNVIDFEPIASSGLKLGVDPMGGAGVAYWAPIAERYGIELDVVNDRVDPSFSFMTLDKDGKIRMDCSSPFAMASLVALKDKYAVAFANDTDFDRHGIVTRSRGLLNPNHYLAVAIEYLFTHRTAWPSAAKVGKTLVSSSMIDRVAASLGREVCEVPVGFKWFVEGLSTGSLAFGGEESAGATFLRRDGSPWSTDKDGIILNLLAAEMTARTGRDPGELYTALTERFGAPVYERLDAPATPSQKARLAQLSAEQVRASTLAGDPIEAKLTCAPGNNEPIGGLKVVTKNGWFAARPSGTENVYKIYTESFKGDDHLREIQDEAKAIVDGVLRS